MFWGVDGGGTSTRGVFQTKIGNCTDLASAAASNILVVGQDKAFAAMDAVLEKMEHSMPLAKYPGVLGLAGCDRAYVREAWKKYCMQRGLKRVWITGDYWLPWANFTHGEEGIIAIFGTGSVVFGQSHNHTIRLGGYGWKLGDPGSGLSIGRQAIKKAILSQEGIEEPTALVEQALTFFNVQSIDQIIETLYTPDYSLRQLADFAPVVFDTAQRGDVVATSVLVDEGHQMLAMINAAVDRLDISEPSVGLSGGMAHLWHPYLQNRSDVQKCGIHFAVITRQAVCGALWLAKKWNQERRPYDTEEYLSQ